MKNVTRDEFVAAIEAASLCNSEAVADAVLDTLDASGPEAAQAELDRAIARNAECEKAMGISN